MYYLSDGVTVMKAIKPLEWIWEPLIPRSCVSVLASRGGVGKTGFALWLANFLAGQGKKVIFFDAERVGFHHKDRASKWNMEHLDKIQFVLNTEDDLPTTTSPETIVEMYDLVREYSPDLVIIDSFTSLSKTFDSNRRDHVAQFYAELSKISVGCDTGILLLAHNKKKQTGDDGSITLDSISGSGAITDLSRSVMTMDFDKNNRPNGRIITQTKFNLTAKSKPLTFKITDEGIVDVQFLELDEYTIRPTESKADKFRSIAVKGLKEGMSKKATRQLLKDNFATPVECGRALDWAASKLNIEWEGEL